MQTEALIQGLERHYAAEPRSIREHVWRVREIARDLAAANGIDTRRADLAALGHDLFRARSDQWWRDRAREYGLHCADCEEVPLLWHGPLAAHWLRHSWRCADDQVIEAVARHTNLGRGAALNPLAQILFLSDKLEPRKSGRNNQQILAQARIDLPGATRRLVRQMIDHWQCKGREPSADLLASADRL